MIDENPRPRQQAVEVGELGADREVVEHGGVAVDALAKLAVGTGLATELRIEVLGEDLGSHAGRAQQSPQGQRLLRDRVAESQVRHQLVKRARQRSALVPLALEQLP